MNRDWGRAQIYDNCDDNVVTNRASDLSCLRFLQASSFSLHAEVDCRSTSGHEG
jgi:hypothetical protein